MRRHWRRLALVLALGLGWAPSTTAGAADDPSGDPKPAPRAECGPGARRENGVQGRVSLADFTSGRPTRGYRCNLEQLGHTGNLGGFRVHRYVDAAGRECAYYDTTPYIPTRTIAQQVDQQVSGVHVVDMSNPRHPVRTTSLPTPAMLSPHESLSLNLRRGLLAADLGNTATGPGFVDVYDVSQDCRAPALKSSLPLGVLGHEGSFAPDGNTFYVTNPLGFFVGLPVGGLTAIDIADPSFPRVLFTTIEYTPHGLNISDDGNTLFFADGGLAKGLTILDVSQIQRRAANPQVTRISHLTWKTVSLPQTAIPVTIGGRPYLVEIDEFASNTSLRSVYETNGSDPSAKVGAARIIDIRDLTRPRVVSDIRLQVHTTRARAGAQANDPGAKTATAYSGHYCSVPRKVDPEIVACTFILSGLRVFDIRDPKRPREIAYFNPPTRADATGTTPPYGAMSAPAFAPERGEIWYSDANYGLYTLRFTNGAWPFRRR